MELNLKLSEILRFLKKTKLFEQESIGRANEEEIIIRGFSSIYESKLNTISWMETQSFDWSTIKSSAIICSVNAKIPDDEDIKFIPVENPRDTFAIVINKFYPKTCPTGISETAVIGENCELGDKIYIGHNVVLGNNVRIGNNTKIHPNVVINDNVSIGSNCIIHSGVVIGAEGFGYHKNFDGEYFKFPHIGLVVIEDNVEVGSNTCIARGKLTNTIIKKNVKIGNLNHISHDVTIYENTMVTHQTHLGGNTRIMQNSWIAPGVILKTGISIGEDALVGMGAVVIRDVNPGDVVAGVPAKPLQKKEKS